MEYHDPSIDEWAALPWQLLGNIILTVEKYMKTLLIQTAMVAALAFSSASAWADDIEGTIDGVDAVSRTLVVQGITFHTTPRLRPTTTTA